MTGRRKSFLRDEGATAPEIGQTAALAAPAVIAWLRGLGQPLAHTQ
jgi:Flp pilus assembly pilin Flp